MAAPAEPASAAAMAVDDPPSDSTRGGWAPTGTAAERRAKTTAAPGRKAIRTRQRLLAAARAAFAEHGYADATVEHIVTAAGLARGSFYTYFDSKPDVFRHLAATIDDEVARRVTAYDAPRQSPAVDRDPVANLLEANRRYLAVVAEHADLYRLVEEMVVHDDAVRAARAASRRTHVRRVARTIARWQQRGWADADVDAELVAAALVAMLSGFAQEHVGSGDTEVDTAAELLTAIWVRACGLSAPRAAAKPSAL